MPEAAPLSRRSLLIGVGAVAATVALPQVSEAALTFEVPELDYVSVLADYIGVVIEGEELDRWAGVWGLARGVIFTPMLSAGRSYAWGSHLEIDEKFRTRLNEAIACAARDAKLRFSSVTVNVD